MEEVFVVERVGAPVRHGAHVVSGGLGENEDIIKIYRNKAI